MVSLAELKKYTERMNCSMKYAAAALATAAFAATGFYIRGQMAQRVRLLEKVLLLIISVRNRLEYYREPVGEIVGYLCENDSFDELCFLDECRRLLRDGEPFPTAWKKSVMHQKLPLRKCDIVQLISLGVSIGTTDLEGQLALLEMHSDTISRLFDSAREQSGKYGGICVCAGLAAGTAAGLFIV